MRSLLERKSISGRGGDSVEIRAFEKGDLDRMVEIWNEVVRAGDAFPQTDELDEDQAADFFSAQTRTAVADDDGRVVGLYILHPNNVVGPRPYGQRQLRGRFIGSREGAGASARAGLP